MSDRLYYCVPDGGRVTVLRRIPNSRPHAVATMLNETQALALATLLNDVATAHDATCAELRRVRERQSLVVAALRRLVKAHFNPSRTTTPKEAFAELSNADREARELLAIIDGEQPAPPATRPLS